MLVHVCVEVCPPSLQWLVCFHLKSGGDFAAALRIQFLTWGVAAVRMCSVSVLKVFCLWVIVCVRLFVCVRVFIVFVCVSCVLRPTLTEHES